MESSRSALPKRDEKRAAVRSMFDAIAPRYDLVNRILTFRMDVGWRKRTTQVLQIAPGSKVLDLACGTGDFCVELAAAGHHPIGIDLSRGMLDNARTEAPLVHGDLLAMPIADGTVDAAVCGFALRNLVDIAPFIAELHRAVRSGGRIALLEVSEPDNRLMRRGHNFYFNRVVPLLGGLISDRSAYSYLPQSVAYLPEPDEMIAIIGDAGFIEIRRTQLSSGIAQLYTATRP